MTEAIAKMSDHAGTIQTQGGAFEPKTFADAFAMAQMIAASNLCPDALKRKPADVMLVIGAGAEYGLSVHKSLQTLHVIKGKVGMSADMLAGLCIAHPTCEHFTMIESTAETCTYATKRKGGPEQTLTYTMDDARAAGLAGSATYKAHGADMLRARCKSKLARAAFPDVVAGLYTPDEPLDSVPVEPVVKTTAEDSLLAQLQASVAATDDEPEVAEDGEIIPPDVGVQVGLDYEDAD